MKHLILIVLLCGIGQWGSAQSQLISSRLSGMTLVAPSDSFRYDPFVELKSINVGWVAVVPYAFTRPGEPKVHFGNNHQWWGESPNGAEATIKLAKTHGLKVMLKPQLWMQHMWVGDLSFDTTDEWKQWEEEYKKYIFTFADIAERQGVEILCIGTEFKKSVAERPEFWKELIVEIRKRYSGSLTYCSNWDNYLNIPFWNALDVIGVSAYFPLTDKAVPSVKELVKAWKPIKKQMSDLSTTYGHKKILFTEYGYMSVESCAGKTWELENDRKVLKVSELAQSNSLEALYTSFCEEDFWMGGFLWKWYADRPQSRYYGQKDYTPQGKKAEEVISLWYSDFNTSNQD